MAKGLYGQMSCRLPDKPEIAEAGDLAELCYYRAVLRCREFLTDGVIDRRMVTRWFAGIRGKPTTHLNRLVDVGMLVEHERGWAIPIDVWTEWNPLATDVDAKREAENERKREWRDRQKRDAERDASRNSSRTRTRRARDGQPEPEPEPEPEPKARAKEKERVTHPSPSRGSANGHHGRGTRNEPTDLATSIAHTIAEGGR